MYNLLLDFMGSLLLSDCFRFVQEKALGFKHFLDGKDRGSFGVRMNALFSFGCFLS